MTAPHYRRLKRASFEIDGQDYAMQLRSLIVDPGEQDGETGYTLGGMEYVEETDPQPTLNITALADWRTTGLSTYLWQNQGQVKHVTITLHPDTPDESVVFEGDIVVKAPPAGGEARQTEIQEITFRIANMTFTHTGVLP